ncbi:cation diffusion facilitator family transporter [Janibacter sp. GXQ6167]|uniref:cation diffusion facilitator family transporter n=1 Tax=Janibacter sp. GXQ6167 TaxID=3240791 RepID=UPI0035258177
MRTESQVLRSSLIVGLLVAFLGIGFGLLAGSFSITFDGMFGLVDAAMTGLSLLVINLITRSVMAGRTSRINTRFSMGVWHFEPMVLTLNATILLGVTSYALINAILTILAGGRDIDFGPALVYAVVVVAISFVIGLIEHRANRKLKSQFVALDVKGWLMAGGISFALLVAFGIGALLDGTTYAWIRPYVDPSVLAFVCVVVLPTPVSNLWPALKQLLLMTPGDLREQVEAIAAQVARDEGFTDYRAAVAQVGRSAQVELFFLVPEGSPARPIEHWDDLRNRIDAAIGEPSPHRWVTIAFTSDPRHL